jgi:hypothetical protein
MYTFLNPRAMLDYSLVCKQKSGCPWVEVEIVEIFIILFHSPHLYLINSFGANFKLV